jgi:hypothetical protein
MLNDPRLSEKLWRRIHVVPQTGCWLWTGSINRDGYGLIWSKTKGGCGKKGRVAHRVFYEILKEAIPRETEIDHLCRIRNCCNPDHLEAVSHRENFDRSTARKGLSRKTHCIRGHEYNPQNTYLSPKGVRACRICRTINNRASQARNFDKVKERQRLHKARKYRENRKTLLQRQKEYAARNKEKIREKMRAYYQANKEKWIKYKHHTSVLGAR